jgi:hypothetical protein
VGSFWEVIAAKRKQSLIMAIVPILFMELFVWGPTFMIMDERTEFFYQFYGVVNTFLVVTWLLAVLGYAKVYLNRSNIFLSWANESVYPLYILHQTVELIIAYYIIQMDMGIIPKFLLVVAGTFGLSIGIYQLFIKRFNFMRLLFGLKTIKREKAVREINGSVVEAD